MLEIRIHGRGGQGNVVAAYLLADAACRAGRHCQAFPAFGAERRGAPVTAFVRIARRPILRRDAVKAPSFLIVQDATLLHDAELTAGLLPGGGILVNSSLDAAQIRERHGLAVVAIPASAMAEELLGRKVPNVALLAAFNSLTGLFTEAVLEAALRERFSTRMPEQNAALARAAAQSVKAGSWKELARGARN
jgi:pyruvate ferredoxin oxidoreductase gamma subunit